MSLPDESQEGRRALTEVGLDAPPHLPSRWRPTSSHSSIVVHVRFSRFSFLGGGAEPFTSAAAGCAATPQPSAAPAAGKKRARRVVTLCSGAG